MDADGQNPLTITEKQRERLESQAHRARSQFVLARRARAVRACAEGLNNKTVGKKLPCSIGMAGKWRTRFLRAGLEGLYDEPRPGAPSKMSDAGGKCSRLRSIRFERTQGLTALVD